MAHDDSSGLQPSTSHMISNVDPSECPNPPATLTVNIVVSIVILILLLLGVVGNVLTLIVITKNRHLQTNFNRFLISLCASDLVSACVCSPLWLYRRTWGYDEWEWGDFLCKFYWVVDYGTDFTTSLHILSFCLLRFMAFSRPFSAPTARFSNNHFRIYIACLWFISIVLSLPHAYFMGDRERDANDPWPACSIYLNRTESYRIYGVVVYSFFFYIPALLIITFSCLTTRILRSMGRPDDGSNGTERARSHISQRRNRSACLQLRLICACHILGYIPLSAYPIWTTAALEKSCTSNVFVIDYWIGVVAYIILRISECLNPVMYNLGCKDMRRATKRFVSSIICRRRSQIARRSTRSTDVLFFSGLPLPNVETVS